MTIRARSLTLPGIRRRFPAQPPTARPRRSRRGWRRRSPCCRALTTAGVAQHGRTTVGLSAMPIVDCGRYIADWFRGKAPSSPREGFSAILMLRFAVDDLKAYYLEAAAAGSSMPSSRQLGDWFWNYTAAGRRDRRAAGNRSGQRRRAPEGRPWQFHGAGRPRGDDELSGTRPMDGSKCWPSRLRAHQSLVLAHQPPDQEQVHAPPHRFERRSVEAAIILMPPLQDWSEHGR